MSSVPVSHRAQDVGGASPAWPAKVRTCSAASRQKKKHPQVCEEIQVFSVEFSGVSENVIFSV